MRQRPFNPALITRLQLEAEAIATVVMERFDARRIDVSNQVANWQPGPMPNRKEASDGRRRSQRRAVP